MEKGEKNKDIECKIIRIYETMPNFRSMNTEKKIELIKEYLPDKDTENLDIKFVEGIINDHYNNKYNWTIFKYNDPRVVLCLANKESNGIKILELFLFSSRNTFLCKSEIKEQDINEIVDKLSNYNDVSGTRHRMIKQIQEDYFTPY